MSTKDSLGQVLPQVQQFSQGYHKAEKAVTAQAGHREASWQSCWLGTHHWPKGLSPQGEDSVPGAGTAFRTFLSPAGHCVRAQPQDPAQPDHCVLLSSAALLNPENPGNIPTQSARRSLQNQLWSSMVPSCCCCLSPTPLSTAFKFHL